METLFRTVLNMSGTGAAVICVVLLARSLLHRAPKRYAYWLWSAAAFRLVCPVSFKSVFSIFSLASAAGATVPAVSAGAEASVISYIPPAVNAVAAPVATPIPTLAPNSVSAAAPIAQPAAAASAAPGASPLFVLGLVWLAGVAAMLIWGTVSYLRLARRLRTAVVLSPGVWQSDAVDSPFLMGFLRPQIYIPFGLAGERLDYVLAHERFHISRRDYLGKLLSFLILSMHWFNPLVWLAFVLMGRDMEMRCDEAVLGRGGAASKPYSETLLSFAVAGRFPGLGPLAFGEPGAKARIRNVLRWKKPRVWVTVGAALLCVLAIAACAANPAERTARPTATPQVTPAPTTTPAPAPVETATVTGPGAYTGVDGYLRTELLRSYEDHGVTVFRTDGSAVRVAVTAAEITELRKNGELAGLAPEGTLEAWHWRARVQLAEDAPELMLVGGMSEENGWYDFAGAHDVVALRYPNGRIDILYNAPVNDGMTFYGYHNSYAEAIYDWYVTAYGLDLPPYVLDWGGNLSADGNYPVHRYDGDGWYLYVPVSGWKLTERSGARCKWESAYQTGSSITIRTASAYEARAIPEYMEGVSETFYDAGDGTYWRVTTQYDPNILIYSSWIVAEPEILARMAGSFRLSDNAVSTRPPAPEVLTLEGLLALQQDDPATYTAQMEGWNSEINMIGEQFVSELGEAGGWQDIPEAFASRWCQKHLNASADNPLGCADAGVMQLADYMNAASLTSSPRRLAFNVKLALGVPADREELFVFARMGWATKNEHGMYEIGTEAVLVSDDGVHWTVEGTNSGGSAGWGWRELRDSEHTAANIRYAIEIDEPTILLRFLPNLDWNALTSEETAAAMRMLQDAAVSDEKEYADGRDQLYRDLYMLWGFKRSDGAYAEMYCDGPHCILARQYAADPQTFLEALAEMDGETQARVRQGLEISD